jgi:hypothetical protein
VDLPIGLFDGIFNRIFNDSPHLLADLEFLVVGKIAGVVFERNLIEQGVIGQNLIGENLVEQGVSQAGLAEWRR